MHDFDSLGDSCDAVECQVSVNRSISGKKSGTGLHIIADLCGTDFAFLGGRMKSMCMMIARTLDFDLEALCYGAKRCHTVHQFVGGASFH